MNFFDTLQEQTQTEREYLFASPMIQAALRGEAAGLRLRLADREAAVESLRAQVPEPGDRRRGDRRTTDRQESDRPESEPTPPKSGSRVIVIGRGATTEPDEPEETGAQAAEAEHATLAARLDEAQAEIDTLRGRADALARQLAEALEIDIKHLRWLTYHREVATQIHYERFTIPKRSGGTRAIWAPKPMLKASQRWILREIVERLPIHGAAHGFIPGRSILTNASQHTNSKIIIKVDLKDFFPTVTFKRVKGVFRKAGYREQIATLLALICTEPPREVVKHEDELRYVALGPRCLPQGAPTSPAITNTLCLSLDRRLTGLAESLGWRYTRYADDLTFSLPNSTEGRPHFGKLMGAMKHIIADEGFTLHPDKTRILRKGASQRVTGLVVNGPGKPRVPRETRRMLRAAVHNAKQGKPLRDDESLYTLLGWSAFIYMTDRELGASFLEELRTLV